MIKKLTDLIVNDSIRSYQFFQLLRLLSMICVSIVLVKLGAQQDEMSQYEWIFFLGNAISFFWSHGLKNGILNYYPKLPESEKDSFIKTFIVGHTTILLFVGIITFVLYQTQIIELGQYPILLLAYFVFGISATMIEHIFLVKQQSRNIAYFSLINYLSFMILTLGGYAYSDSIKGAITGIVLWSFFRFLYLIYLFVNQKGRVIYNMFYPFLLFCLPLIVQVLLGNGMEIVDGFLVKHYFEENDFAIFRYGARELPLNTVLITSMSIASIPLAVQNIDKTLKDIKARLSKLMDILFPLSILLIFSSEYLFSFFYDEEYIQSALIFNIYTLIIINRVLLPQVTVLSHQRNDIVMYVSFIEIAINLILSFLFMNIWGLQGIAWATLAAFISYKIILTVTAHFTFGVSLNKYLPVKKYVLYVTMLIFAFLLQQYL